MHSRESTVEAVIPKPAFAPLFRVLSEEDGGLISICGWRPRSDSNLPAANEAISSFDVTAILADVVVPTLVIQKREIHWMPPYLAMALATGIPGARVVTLEGGVTLPLVGDQEEAATVINDFVLETASRSEAIGVKEAPGSAGSPPGSHSGVDGGTEAGKGRHQAPCDGPGGGADSRRAGPRSGPLGPAPGSYTATRPSFGHSPPYNTVKPRR
jgi:hypothetical protein